MKVLVTGGTSLLGSRTVAQLLKRGDDVTVFQRRPAGLPCREVIGDLGALGAVALAVKGQDAVVHLAAKVAATGTWADFEQINVIGTANLVASAREAGVNRMVHVSTPSVAHAGRALIGAGAAAADPASTRGHYATSKALAELATLGASSPEFPIVAIRPHLVWGPGDEQLIGRIVARARSGRLALVGSGAALIDSTYVDNAAAALVAALDHAPELSGRVLVVSNEEPRTVMELVRRIVEAAGLSPTVRRVPTRVAFGGGLVVERIWNSAGRTDDPPMTSFLAEQLSTAHWFDQRETQRLLRWEPAVSLDEGFHRLREWFLHAV